MSTYVEVARKLPIPTEEQTHEFAEFVTGAHSWYKHLRVHPPTPFVFFLDPNAGKTMVHLSDEAATFVDNTDDSQKFHYTWQTTEAYRRRFGFWNYQASFGTSFRFRGEGGIVDTAGAGLKILSPGAGWLNVPGLLARVGTALVSSLMYAASWRSVRPDLMEREQEIRNAFLFVAPPDESHIDSDRREELMRVLPEEIADALRQVQALWEDESFQREKTEIQRALNELHRKGFSSNRPFDEVVDPAISHALYVQTENAWEMTGSRRKETVLMQPLIAAIDRERHRQIGGMMEAMNRFVETLHGEFRDDGRLH